MDLLFWRDNRVYLEATAGAPVIPLHTTNPPPANALPELRTTLKRIARANNLLDVAAQSNKNIQPEEAEDPFDIRFKLSFRRRGVVLDFPAKVSPGDYVQPVVNNHGNVSFDLTLLYIDERCGIECLFPLEGENNRFRPGDDLPLKKFRMTAHTTGREYLVAIAVQSKGQPRHFRELAQPSIVTYRAAAAKQTSPVEQLLEKGMYGEGVTRSAERSGKSSFSMDIYPFDVAAP